MKKTALILSAVTLILLLVLGWQLLHQELGITGWGVRPVEAADLADRYADWTEALEARAFTGFVYSSQATGEKARFVTYTLRLRNGGLLPAEAVELQLVSENGDLAARQEPAVVRIPPGAEATLDLTLLTESRGSLRRDLVITYYLWGTLHTLRYTLS